MVFIMWIQLLEHSMKTNNVHVCCHYFMLGFIAYKSKQHELLQSVLVSKLWPFYNNCIAIIIVGIDSNWKYG